MKEGNGRLGIFHVVAVARGLMFAATDYTCIPAFQIPTKVYTWVKDNKTQ